MCGLGLVFHILFCAALDFRLIPRFVLVLRERVWNVRIASHLVFDIYRHFLSEKSEERGFESEDVQGGPQRWVSHRHLPTRPSIAPTP